MEKPVMEVTGFLLAATGTFTTKAGSGGLYS
jgi:hypothetical protein